MRRSFMNIEFLNVLIFLGGAYTTGTKLRGIPTAESLSKSPEQARRVENINEIYNAIENICLFHPVREDPLLTKESTMKAAGELKGEMDAVLKRYLEVAGRGNLSNYEMPTLLYDNLIHAFNECGLGDDASNMIRGIINRIFTNLTRRSMEATKYYEARYTEIARVTSAPETAPIPVENKGWRQWAGSKLSAVSGYIPGYQFLKSKLFRTPDSYAKEYEPLKTELKEKVINDLYFLYTVTELRCEEREFDKELKFKLLSEINILNDMITFVYNYPSIMNEGEIKFWFEPWDRFIKNDRFWKDLEDHEDLAPLTDLNESNLGSFIVESTPIIMERLSAHLIPNNTYPTVDEAIEQFFYSLNYEEDDSESEQNESSDIEAGEATPENVTAQQSGALDVIDTIKTVRGKEATPENVTAQQSGAPNVTDTIKTVRGKGALPYLPTPVIAKEEPKKIHKIADELLGTPFIHDQAQNRLEMLSRLIETSKYDTNACMDNIKAFEQQITPILVDIASKDKYRYILTLATGVILVGNIVLLGIYYMKSKDSEDIESE